jgi:uncharacterized protein (TIGR03083 family)
MTPTADETIAALRATHEELAAVVRGLTDEQLLARSGALQWTVAHVLSHLGSGAEIARATLRAAIDDGPPLPDGFNQSVWDSWNAMSPRDQADGFLASDVELLSVYEALTPEQRNGLHVKLGFVPMPLPLLSVAGMRLNEASAHSWDVRVAFDDAAAIEERTARLVVDHFAGGLGFLLGFTAKADQVAEPAIVSLGDLDHALVITDSVSIVPAGADTTATLVGSSDAVARLLSGRLRPGHTPAGVTVTGNVTLEDLRRVFPGY